MSKYLFVTGRLAARALEKMLNRIELEGGHRVQAMNITVAALMNTEFISRHLSDIREEIIIIPGLCKGSLKLIEDSTDCQVLKGPEDLKDLPLFFGQESRELKATEPKLKILAEIVDAASMTVDQILERAVYYRGQGADIIDIGADTSGNFPHLAETVRTLKGQGFTLSIDSMRPEDIIVADEAGVDLVLSINSSNIEIAGQLNSKLVVIPNGDETLDSLYRNIESLEKMGKDYIVDPILPPLTFGCARAIGRYDQVRRDFPRVEMLMGLGNITELTDGDSTGINAVLTGIVTELGIDYVLTTECSNRTVGSVKEVSLARALMHRAMENGVLPKHLDYSLLTIKDPELNCYTEDELREIQSLIKDKNLRIFTDEQYIYVFNAHVFLRGTDAKELFEQLEIKDAGHSFYLGRELYKAELAVKLGKKYVQDAGLDWGYLG